MMNDELMTLSVHIASNSVTELHLFSPQPGDFRRVLVAAAGETNDDRPRPACAAAASFIASATAWELSRAGRMPSSAGQHVEGLQGLVVAGAGVRDAAGFFPIAVLGAGARIVQSGRNAVHVARSGRRRLAARSCSCRAARRAGRSRAWPHGRRAWRIARPPRRPPGPRLRRARTDRTCPPRCCRRPRRPRPRRAAGRAAPGIGPASRGR